VQDQTSDPIQETFPQAFHDDGATLPHSFCEIPSDAPYSPASIPIGESSSPETMDERKFKKYPIARLKKNEFVKNGKFLCNNAECQMTFDNNRERNNHLRKHEKPFHCSWPGCQFKNSWRKDIIRHYDTHYSQKTIPCPRCYETFTRHDNLERHIKETHEGKKRSRMA
jgi:hypothetical protein